MRQQFFVTKNHKFFLEIKKKVKTQKMAKGKKIVAEEASDDEVEFIPRYETKRAPQPPPKKAVQERVAKKNEEKPAKVEHPLVTQIKREDDYYEAAQAKIFGGPRPKSFDLEESEEEQSSSEDEEDEETVRVGEPSEVVEASQPMPESPKPQASLFFKENEDLIYELGPEGVQDIKFCGTSFVFTLWLHNLDPSMDALVQGSIGRFLQKAKELCEVKDEAGAIQADYFLLGPIEKAKTTGRLHRHGIIHLTKRKTLGTLVKYFGFNQQLRLLGQKGTRVQARTYALKELADDNPILFEFGSIGETPAPKGPGKRESDRWKDAYEACKREKLDFDSIHPQIAIMSCKSLQWLHNRHVNSKDPQTLPTCCGLFLFGPPNTGKSHFARFGQGRKPEDCATMLANNQQSFFDGCSEAKHILIEELGLEFKFWNQLKTWADRYPFNANMKGSNRLIRPETIIVTSNYYPGDLYPVNYTSSLRRAVNRRFRFLYFYREYDEDDESPNWVEVMAYESAELPEMEDIIKMVPSEHRASARRLWKDSNETPGTVAAFNQVFPDSSYQTPTFRGEGPQNTATRQEAYAVKMLAARLGPSGPTPPTVRLDSLGSGRRGTPRVPEVSPEPPEGNAQDASNDDALNPDIETQRLPF